MQVITLAQVKAQLGLTDTIYDAQITAKLPIIDAKVKQICRNTFNYRFALDLTSGSTTASAYALYKRGDAYPSGIMNGVVIRDVTGDLEVGMQIEGTDIATGTYITNFYKSGALDVLGTSTDIVYIELSTAAEDDGTGVITTGGISIGYHDVIAKGVMWMINGTNTTIDDNAWNSKSFGPFSVNKGDANAKIDGKSGMPAWFVKGLPRYM